MKIYKDEYHKKGEWTIKSRTEYTLALLKNQEYFKEYNGDEFSDREFFKYYLRITEKRKLTKTLIAKVLKISRFTLYAIKDGKRKLTPREIDILYTICLDEEFGQIEITYLRHKERLAAGREASLKRRQQLRS